MGYNLLINGVYWGYNPGVLPRKPVPRNPGILENPAGEGSGGCSRGVLQQSYVGMSCWYCTGCNWMSIYTYKSRLDTSPNQVK